ncbi:MAG: crossover junction endodeoxyribonuclease RuvC [Chloroflexi bacterium 13_1_40CM_4_68_4]|nr:MAG: crossover junction endodeoxyribonuclease RuvC [Chloroflexi bacterium 13_1_40CM_4_68_4]
MGFAVLRGEDVERLAIVECGVIATPKGATSAERLVALADALDLVIGRHVLRAVAVERLFFNKNVRTAMAVSEARGVALVCAARAGVPVFEYTPHQVKLAVTGYGKADKRQVQQMLSRLLRLTEPIRQDDTADAVAVALCHAQGLVVGAALERAR